MQSQFDTGPLSWVMAETREALTLAKRTLQNTSEQDAESQSTFLKHAKIYLHQVYGALQMVDVDGVGKLLEITEVLLDRMIEGQLDVELTHINSIGDVLDAIQAYLDELLVGGVQKPIRLFPYYRNLQMMKGGEDQANPVDLFFPDLSAQNPIAMMVKIADDVITYPADRQPVKVDFSTVRKNFEKSLLPFLKQTESELLHASVMQMQHLIAEIWLAQTNSRARSFWAVMHGYVELVADQGLFSDQSVRQLFGRINLQIRRLVEGVTSIPESLLRDALFFIARAQTLPPNALNVHNAYQLEGQVPANFETQSSAGIDSGVFSESKAQLTQIKNLWGKIASGEVALLQQFKQKMSDFAEVSLTIKLPALSAPLSKLLRKLIEITDHITHDHPGEPFALEMATSLLFVENAIESAPDQISHSSVNFSADFSDRADMLVARLMSLVSGELPDKNASWLDEMSQKVQQRQTMAAIVEEMHSGLRFVEKTLDAYFRSPTEVADLVQIDSVMHQISGALAILDQDDANLALVHTQDLIRQIMQTAQADHVADSALHHQVAQNIGVLGFLIDALQAQPETAKDKFSFDQQTGLFKSRVFEASSPAHNKVEIKNAEQDIAHAETAHFSTEQELVEQQRCSTSLASSLSEEPHNAEIHAQLLASLEQEQSVARLLNDSQANERASQAIEVLTQTHLPYEASGPINKIISAAGADQNVVAVPALPVTPPIPVSDEAIDAELSEVFLMEAVEVLACVNDTIPMSRNEPGNQDYLITLRRSFHTLKGSSRMVGLGTFGNVAWHVEQVINGWLAAVSPGTDDLYALLEKASKIFGNWVSDLNATGTSDCGGQALIAAAERLKNGEGYSYQEELKDQPLVATDTDEIMRKTSVGVEQSVEQLAEQLVEHATDAPQEAKIIEFPSNPDYFPAFEDNVKKIGTVEISVPLYNVYLAETDEISRFLSRDFSEWRHESHRPVTTHAVHAAHSLAGSSATVGFASLQAVAHALEMVLQRLEHYPVFLLPGEFDTLDRCVACIKEMLHQFALAEMAPPKPEQVLVMEQLLAILADRAVSEHNVVAVTGQELTSATLPKDDIDVELLAVFLDEGNDLFPLIGQTLRALQAAPQDTDIIQSLLRLLHTVKGSARMAGAMALGQHTHDMESQIEHFMQAGVPSSVALDNILARHDIAVALFDQLRSAEVNSEIQTVSLESDKPSVPDLEESQAATPEIPALVHPNVSAPKSIVPLVKPAAETNAVNITNTALVRVRADILDRLVNQAGEISISRSRLENEVATLRSSLSELNDNVSRLRDQLREVEIQAETQMSSRLTMSGEREFDPLEFDRFTRLQELTRMMAESVDDVSTVQSNISKIVVSATDGLFSQARLTRELQQDLMRIRMVPFSQISERLYRITRQVSKELDKRVNLDIRGTSVEIDRNVLEKMAAPFEHLLRNAIVHGIESREKRQSSGKNEIGEILVQIRQEGNEVVIHFNDDGQGLDLRKIREKACHSGLLAADEEVTDAEAINLIFESGFSTAHEVTELAGRGIGMDVVRSEATALGGRVSVASTPNVGSNFTIHLPLTLALTQVVLLRCGDKTYAVPSVLVEQVQQLKSTAFAQAHSEGGISWQGQRVAMHYLSTVLADYRALPVTQQFTPVIIMRSGDERIALHVDQVVGNREVVVKNIGPQLARMIGISGATVLGSGEIVLILNPVPLVKKMEHEMLRTPRLLQENSETLANNQSDAVLKSPDFASPLSAHGSRKNHIVMVVDDSLTMRKVTHRLLVREGYQVVLAKDGVDALQQLQAITPDVMLVDIEMPRMDGFDLTRNVRNDARLNHIPIIMITSRTADKHRNYARELGVNNYFGKPYQEDLLLNAIGGYLPHANTVQS